jgi:hypothetical protein
MLLGWISLNSRAVLLLLLLLLLLLVVVLAVLRANSTSLPSHLACLLRRRRLLGHLRHHGRCQ